MTIFFDIEGTKTASSSNIDFSDYPDGVLIDKAGTFTITGKGSGPVIVEAKKQEVTLIFDQTSIETDGLPCLYVREAGEVTLELKGENSMTMSGTAWQEALNAAVYSRGDLRVTGDGSLSVSAAFGHAIKAKDTYSQDGGSLTLSAAEDGLHVNDAAALNTGSINVVSAGDEGIQSDGDLNIGEMTITTKSTGDGIRAENILTIDGGTLTINSENEGIESKNALTITGGTINIQAVDDAINAANSLEISGGDITAISSTNDGIDSNGSLIISGGQVVSSGTRAPEMAFDTDNTPFELNGGIVIGLGSSLISPTAYTQNVLLCSVSNLQSIQLVQNGTTLLDWSAPQTMQGQSGYLTLGVDGLKAGEAQLILNGQSSTITVEEGVTTIGSVSFFNQGGPGGQGGQMPGGQAPDGQTPPEMPGNNRSGGNEFGRGQNQGSRPSRPGRSSAGMEDTQSSATR